MKKLLKGALIIGATSIVAVGAALAYFSDTEVSTGNTFTAGSVDLKVDSQCHYWQWMPGMVDDTGAPVPQDIGCMNDNVEFGNWTLTDLESGVHRFFNFDDVKPGDWGENTISLHVDDNPSWLCMGISPLIDADNTLTDPESVVDPDGLVSGELAENLHFFAWLDMGVSATNGEVVAGNNIFNPGLGEVALFSNGIGLASDVMNGKMYPLADGVNGSVLGDDYMDPTKTYYIGLAWCAGTMAVDPVTGLISCDGSTMGNEAQTDSISADLSFYVEQVRNNANFDCTAPIE